MTTTIAPPAVTDAVTAEMELLDEPRAAMLCGLSTRTLRRLVDAGKAPKPRKLSRLVRYSKSELLRWIDGGCKPVAVDATEAKSSPS